MDTPATEFCAVTFRLYPGDRTTHKQIARTAGACRAVWNHFLAENKRKYRLHRKYPNSRRKPSVSYQSLFVAFTALRRRTPWLRELPFAPVRYVLKYQADAWQRKFAGGGFPNFKGKRGDDSFTIPQDVRVIGNRLRIPKIGWVKLSRRGGNPYAGETPRRAVVKRDCGKWYCVLVYAVDSAHGADDGTAVAVDMNCGQVADSTGRIHRGPDVARLEARRRRYQRRMARQCKGSNRRAVTRLRLRKTQRKLRYARHNWHHAVSRALADTAHTVVVEDLRTQAMTRSAKGSTERPGTNVKAKAGLNRSILDTGWSQLRAMLEYKAGAVVAVDPAYTSQTCAECGAVDAANRKTQSSFKCVRCGHVANADVNAALNILASGTGAAGRGGGGVARPVRRQIDTDIPARAA